MTMAIAVLALIVGVLNGVMAYLQHRYPDGPPWR